MRFHLIDKLVGYTEWKEADAIKNVTSGNVEFINKHRCLDDMLLLECIFQCAAWLIVISSNQKMRPTIVSAENFCILEHVGIGDQLKIHICIQSHDEEYAVIGGRIYSGDDLCVTLDNAIMKLLDTSELEDTSVTEKYIKYLVS